MSVNKGLLSVDEALAQLLAGARPVSEIETVPTLEAIGRVLAKPVRSGMNVPPMDNSAMDGYAVRVADIPKAGTRLKISQRIQAGAVGGPLEPGTAARIFTGAPMPAGADAVVIQEDTTAEGDEAIFNALPKPGEWVRVAGLDVPMGQDMLNAGVRLGPQQVGLAASVGIASLPVFRRIRVGLVFPGDELAMPGEALKPGSIYNSNRFTLTGLAQALGCEVRDYGIVRDDLEVMKEVLRRAAAECDIVVTNGGVSVGEADFVKPAVEAEGELLMWRIAMKPGRPLAYGHLRRDGKADAGSRAAFIGLPGNPVSSFVTFLWFVRPFVLRSQGVEDVTPRRLRVRADFDWPQPDARREFLRARWNPHGGLDLYRTQDSAVLSSTAWADGLVDNPAGGVIRKGDMVDFVPYSELGL